jgi:hypothetical protein
MTHRCPQCDRLSGRFSDGVCHSCSAKNEAASRAMNVMFDLWERTGETRAGREMKEVGRLIQEAR